jgi:hypothetical protein
VTRACVVDALGEQGFEQLAATIGGSEPHSLLLEVMRRRAAARTPADVLHDTDRRHHGRSRRLDKYGPG